MKMARGSLHAQDGSTRGWLKFIWYAAVALAIFFMGILGWEHINQLAFNSNRDICGVAPGLGCREALNHPWAKFGLLPVPFWAIAVYSLLLFNGPLSWRNSENKQLAAVLVSFTTATSIAFLVLMERDFSGLCPLCLLTHGCHLVFLLVICTIPRAHRVSFDRPPGRVSNGVTIALLILLCAYGVTLWAGRKSEERNYGEFAMNVFADDNQSEAADRFHPEQREQLIYGNGSSRFRLTIIGSLSCGHCRKALASVKSLPDLLNDQVSIVFVPYPLSPACNKNVKGTPDSKAEYCLLGDKTRQAQQEGRFWEWFETVNKAPGRMLRRLRKESAQSRWSDGLLRQIDAVNEAGVDAVPFFLWDGRKLPAVFNKISLEKMISDLLRFEADRGATRRDVKFEECDQC